jgi:hypothetical protein
MFPATSLPTRCGLSRTSAVVGAIGFLLLAALGCTHGGADDDAGTGPSKEKPNAKPADDAVSPIFGVKIPDGYGQWELISVSHSTDEIKGIVGNGTALKAYRAGQLPFPDGSILVKRSWKRQPLDGFDGTFVPGAPTMLQIMVKDSKKYESTGGWGFGRFYDGKPANEAEHKTCFTCHSKNDQVIKHDFVFTHLAP